MRPIYPQPGYTEADLTALLATKQFVIAECFTISLVDVDNNYVFYYTTWQRDVAVYPLDEVVRQNFKANEVLVQGLRFSLRAGVEVDEQTITLVYPPNYQVMGVNMPEALRRGYFDGATIKRDRYFAAAPGSPWIAGIPMFHGKVSTLDSVGRTEAKLKVKSALNLLNIEMPRHLWQPSCLNTLGDSNCGVDRSTLVTHVVLASDGTVGSLPYAAATPSDFLLGTIHIEDGASVTHIRTIRQVTPTELFLSYPLPYAPVTGDQFALYPGCARTAERCQDFPGDWLDRFRGYPYVPVAETAI